MTRAPLARPAVGDRFAKWLVVAVPATGRMATCRCDCGKEKPVRFSYLIELRSRSCRSCSNRELTNGMKHGHAPRGTVSPEYSSWRAMLSRCERAADISYANYGGRGISVCHGWRDSFEQFLLDIGPRPSLDHSLDRIDVNGDYEPANCRWATRREQGANRRSNVNLQWAGKLQSVAAWSRELGIKKITLYKRLGRGWSADATLGTPVSAEKLRAHPVPGGLRSLEIG